MDINKAIEWQETFKKTYKNSPNEIAKEEIGRAHV